MARFKEDAGIRQVQTSTGAAQGFLSLADRLQQFKSLGDTVTRAGVGEFKKEAASRGAASGAAVPITREDGVTQIPKFKEETFFGGIEAKAHNRALRSSYLASLKNELRTGVARIESENPDNLIGFNEAIKGYSNAMLNTVDPSVKGALAGAIDDRVTSSRISVQNAAIKAQNEAAGQELALSAQTNLDEALRFARNGDIPSSASGLVDYFGTIDAQVDAGFMTPGMAFEKKRAAELQATQENIVGNVSRLTAGGKSLEALDMLTRLQEKIPKGFSVKEHDDLTNAMRSEINEQVNIRNRQESEEDRLVTDGQETQYASLAIGLATGRATINNFVTSLKEGKITESQFDKLMNTLNRRGQGITNFSLVNTIRGEIQSGTDPAEIKNTIISNSGTNLTESMANSLIGEVDESLNKESILQTNTVRRARDFIVPSIRVTGPLGALDTEAEQRLANSIREYDTRVLDGEDPWRVADELVGKDKLEQAPVPQFGTKEDLKGAMDGLNAAFDNQEIDESTYNFQFELIGRIQKLSDNVKSFNAARKEADANTVE